MVSHPRVARVVALVLAVASPGALTSASAHSQFAAAFDLREESGRWLLDIQFGNADVAAATIPECRGQVRFEQCLTTHLRRTIVFRTDDHVRSLGRGAIRLGSHVSEAAFEVVNTGTDKNAESVDLAITSFLSLAPSWLNFVRVRGPGIAYEGVFDQHHNSIHVDGDALKLRRRACAFAVGVCLSLGLASYLIRRRRGSGDDRIGPPSAGPADHPGQAQMPPDTHFLESPRVSLMTRVEI